MNSKRIFASLIILFALTLPSVCLAGENQLASIPVSGMHCGACAKAVTDAVTGLPGVSGCEVNAGEGMAKVSYDSEKISIDKIVETITKTGFKASKPS